MSALSQPRASRRLQAEPLKNSVEVGLFQVQPVLLQRIRGMRRRVLGGHAVAEINRHIDRPIELSRYGVASVRVSGVVPINAEPETPTSTVKALPGTDTSNRQALPRSAASENH